MNTIVSERRDFSSYDRDGPVIIEKDTGALALNVDGDIIVNLDLKAVMKWTVRKRISLVLFSLLADKKIAGNYLQEVVVDPSET